MSCTFSFIFNTIGCVFFSAISWISPFFSFRPHFLSLIFLFLFIFFSLFLVSLSFFILSSLLPFLILFFPPISHLPTYNHLPFLLPLPHPPTLPFPTNPPSENWGRRPQSCHRGCKNDSEPYTRRPRGVKCCPTTFSTFGLKYATQKVARRDVCIYRICSLVSHS